MASTTSSSDDCTSNPEPRNLPDDDLIRGFLLSLGTTCLSPADPTAFSRSRMEVCRRIAGIIKKNLSDSVIAGLKFGQSVLNTH